MKKFIIGIGSFALALGLGVVASSAQVTQTAAAIESKALPADAFREKINAAVYDLTVTDVPAIITEVNKASGTAAYTLATTQLVFSAAASAAATNANPTASLLIRVNGTNYYLKLFPN